MISSEKPIAALIYDFDGTLSPGNMQEYAFMHTIGGNRDDFWRENQHLATRQNADKILTYMYLMLQKAKNKQVSVRRESFRSFGQSVALFSGVDTWFSRINEYGESKGILVEHYINSSGLKEIIEGTPIGKYFKQIFACSYLYDVDGVAYWPGVAVNFTNKTQFLFKINKGIDSVGDDTKVNDAVPEDRRRIPFGNMVYLGDGSTDIPCMKLVKDQGGHSIAVYDPQDVEKQNIAAKLIRDHRVNFMCEADYSSNREIEKVIRVILDKIKAEHTFKHLLQHHQNKATYPPLPQKNRNKN